MQPELPYDKCKQELVDCLRSQYPLIFLRSAEETRAIKCAIAAHQDLVSGSYTHDGEFDIQNGELVSWSSINSLRRRVSVEDKPGQADWQRISPPPEANTDPIVLL